MLNANGNIFIEVHGGGDALGDGSPLEIPNTASYASTPIPIARFTGADGNEPTGNLMLGATSGWSARRRMAEPSTTRPNIASATAPCSKLPMPSSRASSPDGMVSLRLQHGQKASLEELALNPAVTASGTLQSITLSDGGQRPCGVRSQSSCWRYRTAMLRLKVACC